MFSILRGSMPLLAVLLLAVPGALTGQAFPGFGGIEGRAGVVGPEQASTGFTASADLDLGYVGTPSLRVILGGNYFSATADRTDGVTGSLNVMGGRAGLRLDLLPTSSISPYLVATVNGYSIDANLSDPTQQDLLSGFNVGAGVGAGLTYALDEAQRMRVTVEGRQVFMNNVGHWAAAVGIRFVPRGRDAYTPVFRYRDPYWGREAERAAAEAERARIEREQAEAERLRLERERQEEERLRAERERAERERLERERQAQMTEEERERARREAERLEEARRLEAERRAAAEAEAEQLRREREAAEAAAREAEARAAEAERRLYDALLDLDRLLTNITEIRETERGLVVVLGQGLFAVGQHALSPRARDEVGRIATVLAQFPQHQISVEGHTDSTGSETLNQRLSEQRAESVRAALIAQGIDPGRVTMVGYGQNRPIADNATAQGRAQNRRVEIVILGARRPGATP